MGLRNKFLKLKNAIESKGLKVILEKTKVMVSGISKMYGITKCLVDPCRACSMRVKANSAFCLFSVVCGSMVDMQE